MNKNTILTAAVIVLVLMNAGIITFFLLNAPPRPDGEKPKKIIGERLRFDHGQMERYESLIRDHQQTIREADREIRDLKTEIYSSLSSPSPSKQDSLLNLLADAQQRIERAHVEHFTALRQLCRPDQQEEFNKLSHELAEIFSPKERRPPR